MANYGGQPYPPQQPQRRGRHVPPAYTQQQQYPQPGYGQAPPPGYQQQPQWGPPPGPPRRRKRTGLRIFLGIVVAFVVLVVIGAALSSGSGSGSGGAGSSGGTITYVVSGSPANVTYGPAGSNSSGQVPMKVAAALGSAQYYAITAQLQGAGSVTCAIKVNGKVISTSTATGSYNIASCEISQDPITGDWSDTNSGG
jgi:hypothetical protein